MALADTELLCDIRTANVHDASAELRELNGRFACKGSFEFGAQYGMGWRDAELAAVINNGTNLLATDPLMTDDAMSRECHEGARRPE